ncbi:efflux RND transporter periplasmic adaptor subunit [Kaarinaea lacus]
MKSSLTFLASFLVATLVLSGCTSDAPDKPKKKKSEHLVETAVATRSIISMTVTRNGTLKAHREVKIYNQEEGRVTELPYYEGDAVNKGNLVARLDDKLIRAQLRRAEATLNKSELDIKRIRDLYKRKLASDQEIANAETEYEVTKADKELLETRLSYTRIVAPIDGIITQRLTEPGNLAEKYTHLLTIADPTSLITEVTVSELLLPELKIGDSAQVRIDALGSQLYPGVITRIHPSLDPVTRRGIIEVQLKPVPEGSKPGQFCRVTLATHVGQRLTVPFRAIRRDPDGEFVFIVNNENKVQRLAVNSGLRIDEQIEIISGLKEGQQVVTKGFLSLKEGTKVKTVNASPESGMKQAKPVPTE